MGDAERQQRPAASLEHAAADRDPGRAGRPRYGAALAIQLLDAAEPGDAGSLTSAQLRDATARILEQKYRFNADKTSGFGLKTPFSTYDSNASIANNNLTDPAIGMSHIALAQKAAEESMVLLKNSNNTLPIKSTQTKIAIIGAKVNYTVQSTSSQDSCAGSGGTINCTLDFISNVRTGDLGSSRVFSDPAKAKGPYAGIMAAASAHGATHDHVQQPIAAGRRRLRRRRSRA